jgi:two-component system response regulator MprA
VRNADEVQSRQTILDAVWGTPFVGDPNTLDVYMGYLRKKVEAKGEAQLLHTVRGVGFMARVGEPKS